LPCIFTVNIDGKPITVMNAPNAGQARAICALPDFRSDLKGLTSEGTQLCTDVSCITVRLANDAEIAAFEFATRDAPVSDTMVFVFLVEVHCLVADMTAPPLHERNRR
jgi:hypothetical protein